MTEGSVCASKNVTAGDKNYYLLSIICYLKWTLWQKRQSKNGIFLYKFLFCKIMCFVVPLMPLYDNLINKGFYNYCIVSF